MCCYYGFWLLSFATWCDKIFYFYIATMLTFGLNLDDPNTFGTQIHRMIKLGLNIDEDPIIVDEKANMPTLEDDLHEGSRMEKVD